MQGSGIRTYNLESKAWYVGAAQHLKKKEEKGENAEENRPNIKGVPALRLS